MTNSQILNYILHNLSSLNELTVFQKVIPMITVDYCESSMHILCACICFKRFFWSGSIFLESQRQESWLCTSQFWWQLIPIKDPLIILIWFFIRFFKGPILYFSLHEFWLAITSIQLHVVFQRRLENHFQIPCGHFDA